MQKVSKYIYVLGMLMLLIMLWKVIKRYFMLADLKFKCSAANKKECLAKMFDYGKKCYGECSDYCIKCMCDQDYHETRINGKLFTKEVCIDTWKKNCVDMACNNKDSKLQKVTVVEEEVLRPEATDEYGYTIPGGLSTEQYQIIEEVKKSASDPDAIFTQGDFKLMTENLDKEAARYLMLWIQKYKATQQREANDANRQKIEEFEKQLDEMQGNQGIMIEILNMFKRMFGVGYDRKVRREVSKFQTRKTYGSFVKVRN
tara:strand:- start:16021 stop:16794 length:774 start_codon:yes stop_codon:yes gene_type:complete